MDEKEFLREKEKLKDVIAKLDDEEKEIEESLSKKNKNYEKDSYVRAHLVYLGEKKLKDIRMIKPKPYFARVDFKVNGEEKEKIYIGKLSLLDSKTQRPIIIDWRAPISNLYYDGRIGDSEYESPEGTIKGTISLKRQYFIEERELKKFTDIDLKTNDELLQVALEEKADDRLKNIVATIQSEQNNIIRAPMNKPLIVQGVAGSGKTTIALHRIAYLIYNYEKQFDPESFMIIAPNKFFLNYISNVLPDLGVENVRQYTFEDLAYEIIGKKLKISDSNEKLVMIVNKDFDEINQGDTANMLREAHYKSIIGFKYYLDRYLFELEPEYIKEDFIISNVRIMSRERLLNLFRKTYKDLDFDKRIGEVKKHIHSKIKANRDVILKATKLKRKALIDKMLRDESLSEEEKKEKRIEIFESFEKTVKYLETDDIRICDDYFKRIKRKDPLEQYKEFIYSLHGRIEDEAFGEYLINNTNKNLNKGEIAFEDLAPIMYLHYKLHGAKIKTQLRHVIIDEAQDYGPFQFSVLKEILKSNSMTILGDIAQGVHFYRGITNWKTFIEDEFEEDDATYTTLEKTYRTTKEIMEKANEVIDHLPEKEKEFIVKGEPVIDRKDSIRILEKESEDDVIKDIINRIDLYKNENFKSIAIIGKDIDECKRIKKKIDKFGLEVNLIQSKDSKYYAGISIVPSYLAKGLEFDSVFLFDVNDEKYKEEVLDIKLLYVAITRAMSKIDIYYIGNKSKLL